MIYIKRLAILGGTFNPPHIGHLSLANHALKTLGADKIIFMTAGNPPHKDKKDYLDSKFRYEMVKLLIEGNNKFVASDFEIKNDGPSYTYKTLDEFKKKFPDYDICFIIGLDSFYDLEKWCKPELVFENSIIAVSLRGGIDSALLNDRMGYYKHKYNARIELIPMPEIEVSSSEIREIIKNNDSIDDYITPSVKEYILKNNLYK